MLSAVRRGPVLARAFRTCAPRTWSSPIRASPSAVCSFSVPSKSTSGLLSHARLFQSQSVLKQDAVPPITEFSQLGTQGLVHDSIVSAITSNMKLSSMTDVQKLTISRGLTGADT
jgi:ATP-dependent RNA helicase MSS116